MSQYVFFCQTLQPETRNLEFDFLLVRLHSAYQGVRKAALDVHMVAVAVPREVIFSESFRQFRRFGFQLFGHLQPMLAGGNTVHSFLIERVGQNVGPWYAVSCLY